MNAQILRIGSVPSVRFLGALRGGMEPVQPCMTYDAVHVERAEDRADSIRASHTAQTVRNWLLDATELEPAEGTPRLKGVVGVCPRSVPT